MRWQDVNGWLSEAEGSALRRLAAGKEVLELGSYCGRSTVCMAPMAVRVTSIDQHTGDRETGPADTLEIFRDNLARFGVGHIVDVLVGDIGEVGATLPDRSFDLVFIDSAHDAASVARDARLARRVVRPGGVIAWHDCHYQTVIMGLNRAGIDALRPDGVAETLAWIAIEDTDGQPA